MNMPLIMLTSIVSFLVFMACGHPATSSSNSSGDTADTPTMSVETDPRLKGIKLPAGFKIEIYADNLKNARSMDLSPSGILYVGTRDQGSAYAIKDSDGDYHTDKTWTLATGLNMPNGVAFRDGDLYLAEVSRIWKFPAIEGNLDQPKKEIFIDNYPSKEHHGWKYIAFGPDGHLYIPVGAPCNVCKSDDDIFASITRIHMTSKKREIVQHGIRNTVGFTWHPQTKEMWFTDNGGDWLGDDMPACELNYAPKDGMHFGYPYCHQGDFLDPKLGGGKNCADYTAPAQKLGAHVAPLGIEFYTGTMFPEEYRNQIFIAEHGSWNRSTPSGYRIVMVRLEGNRPVSYEPFAEGWLEGGKAWGRPVDIELMPDGSMLVSDDFADVIYRISYSN